MKTGLDEIFFLDYIHIVTLLTTYLQVRMSIYNSTIHIVQVKAKFKTVYHLPRHTVQVKYQIKIVYKSPMHIV